MLSSIELSVDKADFLKIDLKKITIFVGPNNSGKSLLLKEVEKTIKTGRSVDNKIIKNIDLDREYIDDLDTFLDKYELKNNDDSPDEFTLGKYNFAKNELDKRTVLKNSLTRIFDNPQEGERLFEYVLWYYLVRLDGRTRFSLTDPQPTEDLQQRPSNHLMALFKNDEAREELRDIIFDALGLYYVIDPTGMKKFKIRMSSIKPDSKKQEQGLDECSREFHHKATDIAELSDGVKAFTGLLTAIFSSTYKILLVDEPEAFLHPPLSRKLGQNLSELAPERNANLLVSTHSADFIMGCIQSGQDINIVRLTYNDDISSARLLPSEELAPLMRDPLLRSVGVISALFHDAVVITEADSDRAFYQEINDRLLASKKKGIHNCLFLNAQNKQTIPRIMGPLKRLGIPTAGILDIDVIKGGGKEWGSLMKNAQVNEATKDSLNSLRAAVKKYFDKSDLNMKVDGGISILKNGEREACEDLFSRLGEYGIFVVPNGESESWLKHLGCSNHGSKWLMEMFEKMGSNPTESSYVTPNNDDVWKFIESIAKYFDA